MVLRLRPRLFCSISILLLQFWLGLCHILDVVPIQILTMLHLYSYPFTNVQVEKGPTRVGVYHTYSSRITFLLIFNERCSLKSNLIFTSLFGTMIRNNGHKCWCDVITTNVSVNDVIVILYNLKSVFTFPSPLTKLSYLYINSLVLLDLSLYSMSFNTPTSLFNTSRLPSSSFSPSSTLKSTLS